MRVLVTGAGGVIGGATVRELAAKGSAVVALTHSPDGISCDDPKVQWKIGDIRDAAFLASTMRDIDRVVHLAARKSDEPDSYAVNVTGTQNVLEACLAAQVGGLVYVSSISAGFSKTGIYGSTKHSAELLVKSSAIPSVILRPSIVYDTDSNGVIGTLMRYSKLPFIPVLGAGTPAFRPIAAEDVAAAIGAVLASTFQGPQEYDLGGPDRVSFNDLARMVGLQVMGKRISLLHIPLSVGYAIAKTLSAVMAHPPLTVSNVLGMAQEAPVDAELFFARYDVHPRSLAQGFAELKEARHTRNAEPTVLMRYVCSRKHIPFYLVRLYERAQQQRGLTDGISPRLRGNSLLLGAFDAITRLSRPHGIFQQKIAIAAAIAECSPFSSRKLLPQKRSLLSIVLKSFVIALSSGGKLVLGLFLLCVPGLHNRNA